MRTADTEQLVVRINEFRHGRVDEVLGEAEPVGELERLIVEIGDLLACRLQRLPDALQRAVLGIEEVVESLLQVGAGLGRPDLFGEPEEFCSGGVGPERIRRGERLGGVQGGVEVDTVASGAEHLGSVGGDGRPVIGRGSGGEAVTSAVPVVDLLEAGVLEERGGQVVAGALGRDAAAGLGGDGDGGEGMRVSWVRGVDCGAMGRWPSSAARRWHSDCRRKASR